jgi:hypothetical protein
MKTNVLCRKKKGENHPWPPIFSSGGGGPSFLILDGDNISLRSEAEDGGIRPKDGRTNPRERFHAYNLIEP